MPSSLPAPDVDAFTSWTRATSIARKAALFLFPLALVMAGGAVIASAERVHTATLIITTTADSGAGSLRAAIAAASNGDTIQFDPVEDAATRILPAATATAT